MFKFKFPNRRFLSTGDQSWLILIFFEAVSEKPAPEMVIVPVLQTIQYTQTFTLLRPAHTTYETAENAVIYRTY